MTEKTKPAAEIKVGPITGTIWKNSTDKGAFYNITFARLYKKGEQWKRSASFGPDDLPNLAAVAERAAEKITELMSAEQPN